MCMNIVCGEEMEPKYYFISDLHIGGDEALGICDFETELIAFIEKIGGEELKAMMAEDS